VPSCRQLGPLERASFRMLGIQQFMTLRIVSAEP
jgi:hypothetical protein